MIVYDYPDSTQALRQDYSSSECQTFENSFVFLMDKPLIPQGTMQP